MTLEQLPTVDEAIGALNRYEAVTGKLIDAVIPFEVGGGNSTIPPFVAAMKAFPASMATAWAGHSPRPR